MANELRREVECLSDRGEMLQVEAERVVAQARRAIAHRGRYLLALAGGSTPRPLYELLASRPFANRIDWPKTESRLHRMIDATAVARLRGEYVTRAAETGASERSNQ